MTMTHFDYSGPQHCDFCAHRIDRDAITAFCPEAFASARRDGYPVRGERMPDGNMAVVVALDEVSGNLCPDFKPMRLEALAPRVGRDEANAVYGIYPQ